MKTRAPLSLGALRVFGYCRVSTSEQATNGVSLDEQERRIVAECMGENWQLTEMYIERGISGSMPLQDRPVGRQLLRAVQPGDVILAAKLDGGRGVEAVARLVDAALTREDPAGEDEGLRPGAALGEAAIHEKLIGPDLRGRTHPAGPRFSPRPHRRMRHVPPSPKPP